ncbi:nucleotidyltransferase family protein [Sphingomonas naphthae]|uniref:Nucleotidyltransferase family protein n=1 Tax=Sphingomonas naphthae TaxID=1813468 RepID=A0ABY7TPB7_9SPHN|nr:nucleotidyltransferase family protein [Sphingomonas naphthae]WCT74938.1 nucleotidyltransferase family protein [Sphingomonas naphthae]
MTQLWPDETQRLLLIAAMEPDAAKALVAFDAWRGRIDLDDHLDQGSFRLLPLLHANLKRHGSADPLMGRLAGTFRRSWAATQEVHHQAATVLALLREGGVATMANKGLVLGLTHYAHPAHRPMSDVDLIVRRTDLPQAVTLLRGAGWIPQHAGRYTINWHDIMLYRHSVGFRDSAGRELDLHWAPAGELSMAWAEERFWAGAQPMAVRGEPTLRLSPTDLALHTALHGLRYNVMPPLRWIADLGMILAREDEAIDWDEMADFASRAGVLRRLGLALDHVRRDYGLAIPDAPIARGAAVRPRLAERMENWAALADPRTSRVRRFVKGRPVASVARMIQNDNARHIPRILVRWAGRNLKKSVKKARGRLR